MLIKIVDDDQVFVKKIKDIVYDNFKDIFLDYSIECITSNFEAQYFEKGDIFFLDIDLKEIMDSIVQDSNGIYRDLVFGNEHFYDYFFEASPIKEVSSLNIGSRPAARKTITDISGLRAIPWVFSWSQSRIMFPGWYGVGSAFKHFIDAEEGNLEKLQHMYEKWPFFHSLLSNVDMVLSKSNMNIAFQYSKLAESEEVRKCLQCYS